MGNLKLEDPPAPGHDLTLRGILLFVPRLFIRALSRKEARPPEERPTGYGWGFFFAAANGAVGLGLGGLALGLAFVFPPDSAYASLPRFAAAVLGAFAFFYTEVSVCAFARRFEVCYLIIIAWLMLSFGLLVTQAVLSLSSGRFTYVPAYLAGLALTCAWLAYFGNRRHLFRRLREPTGRR
ncbi:MAG TPA: hypothetical protein ENN51_06415 [candidate division WOR-3 bacterium]|uniref:Uncharacterized protein n=1 Tax=candidate division WOR-3 bacterium TaxID=2052148 RepID=A0A7V0T654_UNCW3|nr:hypothetical protein [candidate division WOR-3 bacterium]